MSRFSTMLGKLLEGRYQVVKVLSAGRFGKTYIAQDTTQPGNLKCVVKQLKPASKDLNYLENARGLFNREAEILEQVGKHDQIPQLLGSFEEDREFYLVEEFIEGHPLSTELQPDDCWLESEVIQLLQDVLGILAFIHSHGVIHRDIKPDNLIRRTSDGKLVLINFGGVKQLQTRLLMPDSQMNATVSIGSLGYMSCEEWLGRPSPGSDIYSLGIIGIQALTGRLSPTQFQADPTTGEMPWQHQVQVSSRFASVLCKMVRYDNADRYQSAQEVLRSLERLSYAYQPTQLPSTPRSPVSPTQRLPVSPSELNRVPVAAASKKFPLLIGGSIVAVVSVVGAIAYIKSGTTPPPIAHSSPTPTPSVTSSPETTSSPTPTPSVTSSPSNTTVASSSNEFDTAQFPKANCGDSLPTDSATPIQLYPVFIDSSDRNLQTVTLNFCADAYRTTRSDTSKVAIQVASFTDRSRAELFRDFMKKKVGSGDVGQPTSFSPQSSTKTPSQQN